MNNFIWVRDRDKREHYINIDHIVRVTKVRASANLSEYAYIVINESGKHSSIDLSKDDFDTYQDVINKIQAARS
jgi:hypothetical protein